ncbi:hypothetical protein [Parasphingorhabdus cellanae]|uniref:VanZ-like domain-containing protein n=1 Tax=Parasphingorhabdus cellanae TaxID=2806553 RepID=A0ABX7T2U9_9SPHN|nr:hypothetical protein [Parasphingorhabdus cellanae]QTD55885.1 hypothetical protein J4G78_17150 [Parasphingorhabdus cellanae]
MQWLEIKIWLESTTGLDRDVLHIYGAIAIQFGLALFFRRSLASPWPWLAVLIAAAANEYLDYQRVGDSPASIALFQAEGYKDMWNTMLIPTFLLLVARFWPSWIAGKSKDMDRSIQAKIREKETI